MRISDWSSDVCSSDLLLIPPAPKISCARRTAEQRAAGRAQQPMAGKEFQVIRHRLVSPHTSCSASGKREPFDTCAIKSRAANRTRFGTDEWAARYKVTEIGRASCRERGCQYV